MKILIYSPSFYPNIGGLETIISTLAHEFTVCGHEVKLVSQTPGTDDEEFSFEVIRQPQLQQLLKLTIWCDVFFQACISLKGIWLPVVIARPIVITHQTWYRRVNGQLGWQDYIKRFVTNFATNISVSHAIAEHIPGYSTVIPNSYREDLFYKMPEIARDKELIFLGRLVSDKGADLLLSALANLKTFGITPKLTIVGTGLEEAKLHQQVKDLDILHQVDFVGVKVGNDLAQLLNAHQILVVPSRWQEPFGIVALEGIACGCVVIGSEGGGLKEAIGPCGVTFTNGNLEALTQVMISLLTDNTQLVKYQQQAESHLTQHRQADIGKAYLTVFQQAIRNI